MSELLELYQSIILDHNKRPRNFRRLVDPTHRADGYNPACGDEVEVALRLGDDGRIADVAFQGEGCAISRASASLLTERVKGLTPDEARAAAAEALRLLTDQAEESFDDFDRYGDLAALSGVRRFPQRIKCATLAWHALQAALDGRAGASTEG